MQTILGAGGAIGRELAKSLPNYTDVIRLVSRNPQKVNQYDQLFPADLTRRSDVMQAVKDSQIVYLTVGFPYNIKIWQQVWPQVMENVLDACAEYGAKLVFFDNIYMYHPDYLNGMTENTPIAPTSKKGEVRAKIARMLLERIEKGEVEALIARSADFYGPSIQNTCVLTETVFNNLAEGKPANWLGSLKYKHSFTYTPDAGAATALLGNMPDAYNQVWHLPTAGNPPTGREWVNKIAAALNVKPRIQVASKPILNLLGLFNPMMRELAEMVYQNDRDYVFNSSKFEKRFDFTPTSYNSGIQQIVSIDYS